MTGGHEASERARTAHPLSRWGVQRCKTETETERAVRATFPIVFLFGTEVSGERELTGPGEGSARHVTLTG